MTSFGPGFKCLWFKIPFESINKINATLPAQTYRKRMRVTGFRSLAVMVLFALTLDPTATLRGIPTGSPPNCIIGRRPARRMPIVSPKQPANPSNRARDPMPLQPTRRFPVSLLPSAFSTPSTILPAMASLSLAAGLLLTPAALHGQCAPSVDAPPPPSTAAAPSDEGPILHDGQTLKVNVNLVDVYFSVRDKGGFVTSLSKDSCQIAEDKTPQTIKRLTLEKNLPLTIGILLDTSGSQEHVLPLEQDAGSRFLREVITPKDEAFLISFDVNVDELADFTNSPRELTRAINKASINEASSSAGVPGIGGGPFPTSNPRGTLLYDAIHLASTEKLQTQAGRKVIIVLTDGQDQGSQYRIKDAIEAAQKANVIVYPILIADRAMYASYGEIYMGSGAMSQIAEQTGGRVINVGNNGRKLDDAFDQIQDELRSQYIASYTPTNKTADGKFRKIEMDCGKGLKIQARKGYYAVPGGDDPTGNQ
ncbi:VWFA-related domain-containing protein [Bryocella elongata]|uniref:VWFA-related domain-containing protein n=2 Tax=Bryocella elongata TaxID=863522 RepID=A0A1H5WDT9_9BACT|nr:VWFA-related domain-containing protein [Bryocella elongata]